ncbi:MAG: hypothetical protein HFH82_16015 [Lachnospiraceae bacterium]|nr:hypothetical protein [Lachnospiraceae bacterium]
MKSKKGNINVNRQSLENGIALYKSNPLFSRLQGYLYIYDKSRMGKKSAAYVDSYGCIYLNQDVALMAAQWAYVIAHCKLHLAFGHFDGEKMPGYWKKDSFEKKKDEWKVNCNTYIWNVACDIYIARFLHDIKFGAPLSMTPIMSFPGSMTDEKKIYQYLIDEGCVEQYQEFGTSYVGGWDMQGLDKPLFYDEAKHEKNSYVLAFAYALADSVSHVVSTAGGHDSITSKKYTQSQKAAMWFINHYPLLGGLASGFRVIEDYHVCIENDISVAAVDVTCGEIYVNPAAGLNMEELKFVLAHEFLHAGLQHHERCQGRDHELWNIACDYVINGWLQEMQIGKMPERGLLYDESLKNISAESLYDRMVKDLKKYAKLETFRGYGKGDIIGDAKGSSGFRNSSTTSLDDFYKSALQSGLEYHNQQGRGYIPAGLIEEIRALAVPPIPWDVELARWFDCHFDPVEKKRSYARPSRRQGSTPDIPRPNYVKGDIPENSRTFGVVVDTSGSMGVKLIGYALGAIASYAAAKEVPLVRVVFCDACAYDAGYLSPEEIAGRVRVKGGGGTVLQPGVDLLENAADFPKDGPVLIITDGRIEEHMTIRRKHAFLIPKGKRLPFRPRGEVFYFS